MPAMLKWWALAVLYLVIALAFVPLIPDLVAGQTGAYVSEVVVIVVWLAWVVRERTRGGS